MVLVDEIQLQGRGDGYDEWVKKYRLQYSENLTDWKDVEGGEEFTGNSDRETIVSNKLANSIKCAAIRIIPTEWQQHISMRCEVIFRNQ